MDKRAAQRSKGLKENCQGAEILNKGGYLERGAYLGQGGKPGLPEAEPKEEKELAVCGMGGASRYRQKSQSKLSRF